MLEPIRLGDSALYVRPESDKVAGPDEIVIGWGGTLRDGIGLRAERGGVEVAVLNGLILDPVAGIRRASIGISDHRIVAIGRAGNPDTMDDIDVVLDTGTSVFDAGGMVVTPGAVDSHIHWLSPQVCEAALAGGTTTLCVQDSGPTWNTGVNPVESLRMAWAAFESVPLSVAFLVRGSSAHPEPVERSLAYGGAGLKVHEDLGAGPAELRGALDLADRFDVQVAIHTDGLNELLSVADTARVLEGRTAHLFHIEGVGGGHAPDILELSGRRGILTSSTTPTVPYGAGAEAEHFSMTAASHQVLGRPGDGVVLRERVRPWTMEAESVLHDLGVIPMIASDSQGMGRAGEVFSRAFQTAHVMAGQRGRGGAADDNDRVLRFLAKVTINPARTNGISRHVGSLEPGKLADLVVWQPRFFAVRPELILKGGAPVWGVSGAGNGSSMTVEPSQVGPQVAAGGRAPAVVAPGFVAVTALDSDLPTERLMLAVEGCRDLSAEDMVRNSTLGAVVVDRDRRRVSFDGEPLACEPATDLPFSRRYLLG